MLRQLPARLGASAARPAAAARLLAPRRRWLSSGAEDKDKQESERVHGTLDATQVRSKAMRARLARQERQQQEKQDSALLRQEPPPEENRDGAGAGDGAGGGTGSSAGAPTFGTIVMHNVIAGFGMAIAFSLVGLAFRAVFGGGGGGARPAAPAAPAARLAPPPPRQQQQLEADDGFAQADEGDADPYASRTQQGVAPGAGRPRSVSL